MELNEDRRIDPVCKFGPGGDYSAIWPPGPPTASDPSAGALTRVLASLADIIGVVSGVARGRRVAALPNPIAAESDMETTSDEAQIIRIDQCPFDKPRAGSDTPADSGASTRRFLLRQAVLFADDCRAGPARGRRPHARQRVAAADSRCAAGR